MTEGRPSITLEEIQEAQRLIAGTVRPTPMERSRVLSERLGYPVYLKCENLQRAGSFKIRGAYTRLARLSDAEKARGVVAASAGNHAQGVALAAQKLGIKAKVYMPVGAPMPKLLATQAYGAEVEQVGLTLDEAMPHALRYAEETGAIYIHPFDHLDIIRGQGTCGLEILEQVPDVGTILVSLGGGGLLAGIALAVKALKPDVEIIGVQAESAAAYPQSLSLGAPTRAERMATMADGIAVGLPGEITFDVISRVIDGVETVTEEVLSQAMLFLLERAKLVVEPAGAAALGRLLQAPEIPRKGPVVAVLSGGNIDPLLLLRVVRHGMVSAGRYLQLRVRVPDKPGHLAQLLATCAANDANVLEVEHVRTDPGLRIDEVEIALQLETKGSEHCAAVVADLRARGYVLDSGDGFPDGPV